MNPLPGPIGFDSETGFVLWEASVADRTPSDDDKCMWRHFRIKRREDLTDADLYRVADKDSDPEIRAYAATEITRRKRVVTDALLTLTPTQINLEEGLTFPD